MAAALIKEALSSTKFLPVESVLSVASNLGASSYEIPERYIRPEVEADTVIQSDTFELPTVDLARLRDPRSSEAEIAKLSSACEEWGIFQLINHGVDEGLLERAKADITAFFGLPLEQKMAIAVGKNGEGFGQHFVISNEQKLDWADLLYLNTRPVDDRNFQSWPAYPPTFRDTFDKYSYEMDKLAKQLLEALSKDLRIEPEVLFDLFQGMAESMRMNYYPPCPQADKVLGLSAHTDRTGLTLLLPVNDVPGLQIRKDNSWLSVNSLPGSIVVNIGDILEIASNGKYRSIEHRAVVNPTKERISIATFKNPHPLCTVGPLPQVVKGGKENYKSFPYIDYFKEHIVASKLEGRSYLESLKI